MSFNLRTSQLRQIFARFGDILNEKIDLAAARMESLIDRLLDWSRLSIGKVTLQGGNVNFSDFFIQPNYTANLTGVGGAVSGQLAEELLQGAAHPSLGLLEAVHQAVVVHSAYRGGCYWSSAVAMSTTRVRHSAPTTAQ